MPPTRRMPLLLALLALGFLLRVTGLAAQPLWWDEGYSAYFAALPTGQMVAETAADIHPPLYYLLLHGWAAGVGFAPEALRLFSAFVGTLALAVAYRTGAALGSPATGTLAALLLAVHPFHVFYSQEVRMYGLVALWSLWVTGFAARLWREGERAPRRVWLGYVLSAAALLYTQYYAAFLLVGHAAAVLWRQRPRLRAWLAAWGGVLLLYLPWLVYAAPRLTGYVAQKVVADADRAFDPVTYAVRHLAAFTGGHFEGGLASFWPVALVPLLYLVVSGRRQHGSGRAALHPVVWVSVAAALVIGFVVQLRFPFSPPRFERLMLFALPPFVLWLAARLAALPRRQRGLGIGLFAAVAVVSLYGFYTVPRYTENDYRPLLADIRHMGRPTDIVYCVFPWQVGYVRSTIGLGGPQPVLSPAAAWGPQAQAPLADALAAGRRIWFPEHLALGALLERQAEAYLRANAIPVLNDWHGPNTRLTFWSPVPELAAGPAAVPFTRGLTLHSAHVSTGDIEAGSGLVAASLVWQLAAPLDDEYRVRLRLADAAGQTWGQRDSLPAADSLPFADWPLHEDVTDRHGLWVPAGTPPGEYALRLSVYRAADGVALDVLAATGLPQGVELTLAAVTVVPPATVLPAATLPVQHPHAAALGPLRLLGYSLPPDTAFAPGATLPLTLFWQARQPPAADYLIRLRLTGADGSEAARHEAGFRWPTGGWRAGELAREMPGFTLPAGLRDGTYRLHLALVRPADGWASPESVLATVQLAGRPRTFTPPEPQHPLDVRFGDAARLVGYDVTTDARPGGTVRLVLHWQALATPPTSYSVFVHLLAPNGRFAGQHDSVPGNGAFPTTGWQAGEYLQDEHAFAIANDAPGGTHILEIGLYDPIAGQRLAVLAADGTPQGDHLLLSETPITFAR